MMSYVKVILNTQYYIYHLNCDACVRKRIVNYSYCGLTALIHEIITLITDIEIS